MKGHTNKAHFNPTFLDKTLAFIPSALRREPLRICNVHEMGSTLSGLLQGHVIERDQ